MAQVARRAQLGNVAIPVPNLPRPGRRAVSLTLGLAFPLLLVDAIFHPGPATEIWTIRTIQQLPAVGLRSIPATGENATGSTVVNTTWGAAPISFPTVPWWVIVAVLAVAVLGFRLHTYWTRSRATGAVAAAHETSRAPGASVRHRSLAGKVSSRRPVSAAVPPAPPQLQLLRHSMRASEPSDAPCRAA